jgi:N-acyl-D-aspartate/D-glutamate deacylase
MDTVLKGAQLIDGTGAPARRADVAINGGRISAIEDDIDVTATDVVVDLSGLTLAPGFIDPHTHYDAQLLWDPDISPTSLHGVTTVIVGNCGFGIAPMPADQRDVISRTLENVEGMSAEVLAAGIPWSFESFPDYLSTIKRHPKRLNVGVMIGHTPVRMFVLGSDANRRAATEDEIEEMRQIVREALHVGALGFSTSRSPNHQGDGGRPVPSRMSERDESRALCAVLGEEGIGIIQATPGPGLDLAEMAWLSTSTGRPLTWTALFTGLGKDLLASAGDIGTVSELLARTKELGGDTWPQIASLPQVMQITMADPFPFGMLDSFAEVLSVPRAERPMIYRKADWRARAHAELPERWHQRWAKTTVDESEVHSDLVAGPTLEQIANDRGCDPFDLLLDLSLEEDLGTRFKVILGNDDEGELSELIRDPRCLLAVSDGGAHVSQLCDARYPTHFLRRWVRERAEVTLEEAIWRMTGHPASVFGIVDRGLVRVGYHADLVAFDPDTVTDQPPTRVYDLPANGDRLIAGADGIHGVWVNGDRILTDGVLLDDRHPGTLVGPRVTAP